MRDSTIVSLSERANRNECGVVCFDESTQERTNERGENESEGLRQAEHAQREGVADLRREHTGTNERVALGEGSGKAKTRKVATKGRCPRHAIEREKKERKERANRKSEKKERKERAKGKAKRKSERNRRGRLLHPPPLESELTPLQLNCTREGKEEEKRR